MANIILNSGCKRNCSYCFAKDSDHGEFTLENFKAATAFIATGPPEVHLLGGEPTDHRLFNIFVEHLLNNEMRTRVFTNGMVEDTKRRNIRRMVDTMTEKHREIDLFFNVNYNNPAIQSTEETELQELFFRSFSEITYIGHTIYDANEDLTYLPGVILNYGLDPVIRLGLALPICDVENIYLSRKDYRAAALNIIALLREADRLNIEVHFDCGFPMCMFTYDELGEVIKMPKADVAFICGNALDIYPSLEVTNCFPLSKLHSVSIKDFKNIKELYEYYYDLCMTAGGSYTDHCTECFYFMQGCSGGCKAHYMLDLRRRRVNNAAN